MPLTESQRAALESKARERGIDPVKLIAEAEAMMSAPSAPAGKPESEKPKLFMYLLPFVTVREVRENWLGLSDSFPGDGSVAAEWASRFSAAGGDDE